MSDFEVMSNEDLILWRDHLIDSFTPGSTYYPKFRFLAKSGVPPKLSMLRMGAASIGNKQKGKGKTTSKRIGAGNAGPAPQEKEKGKPKGRRKSKKAVQEEVSGVDGDRNVRDDRVVETEPPIKKRRVALKRKARFTSDTIVPGSDGSDGNEENSSNAIQRVCELLFVVFCCSHYVKSIKTIEKEPLLVKKARPGSQAGRLSAIKREAAKRVQKSMYLQSRKMVGSTLPISWSRETFSPTAVSSSCFDVFDLEVDARQTSV